MAIARLSGALASTRGIGALPRCTGERIIHYENRKPEETKMKKLFLAATTVLLMATSANADYRCGFEYAARTIRSGDPRAARIMQKLAAATPYQGEARK